MGPRGLPGPGELKFWGSGFTGVCLLDHVWWSNVGWPGFLLYAKRVGAVFMWVCSLVLYVGRMAGIVAKGEFCIVCDVV